MHIVHNNHQPGTPFEIGVMCALSPADVEALEALAADNDEDDNYVPCKWEERFECTDIDTMLHLLDLLIEGLPEQQQQALLLKASTLPGLHGQFVPLDGRLSFHAIEGEVLGKSELWVTYENGERKKMW